MKLITKELKNSFIENYGIEANDIFTFYAEEDLEKQQEQVEKLMERGVCGLIIQAVEEGQNSGTGRSVRRKTDPGGFY
ncbi:MAG: hypothetical protein V8S98_01715 [Lachnospiraceae bacterium]